MLYENIIGLYYFSFYTSHKQKADNITEKITVG